MSKKITMDYFGFEGTGRTVTAAKQNAGRKIEALHSGDWNPLTRTWLGSTILIYRTLAGWQYTFLNHRGAQIEAKTLWGNTGGLDDKKEVIRNAENHLVQAAWLLSDALEAFPDWFTDEKARKEAIEYRQWQLRYKQYREEGLSENEAHQKATENGWRQA